MRKMMLGMTALAVVAIAVGQYRTRASAGARRRRAAAAPAGQAAASARTRAARPPAPVSQARRHLPRLAAAPGAKKPTRSIDGKQMLGYVSDLAAVSRHYRDAGHPQFWGRIIGTSADQRRRAVADGQDDADRIDRRPRGPDRLSRRSGFPSRGISTATSGDKTLKLTTAQPAYTTPGHDGRRPRSRSRLRRSRQRGRSHRPRSARQSRAASSAIRCRAPGGTRPRRKASRPTMASARRS